MKLLGDDRTVEHTYIMGKQVKQLSIDVRSRALVVPYQSTEHGSQTAPG